MYLGLKEKNSNRRGSALFYVLLVMSIFTVIAGLVLTTQLNQFRFALNETDAIVAFYAADTGIELFLYEMFVNGIGASATPGTLPQDDCMRSSDTCDGLGVGPGGGPPLFEDTDVFVADGISSSEYRIFVPQGELHGGSDSFDGVTVIRSIGTVSGGEFNRNRAIEITILEG